MLGLLAKGGMAEIYLALSGELTGFRTLVVVKRILPHLASNSDFIKMFFDEARIVAMLDHPNIVRIIEVGQDGDEYFLAMEVVQGKPLSSLVRKAAKQNTPLSQAQAAYLVAQAANGLGYAHNLLDSGGRPLNVVHRDVSPQNILVSYEGAVKVIDFGVARALGRATETRPGGLKGKIQYMAPEQAAGRRVDRRSDVFALGVVLWEAICGRRPFRRESDLETLRAIVEEPIPAPSKFVRIPPRLEAIVMRALQKNPGERFQTAQELALALERYAFASQGFNPVQIGVTMKGLFASDFARWKNTVAAATKLEGEPEQWANTSGTYLRPQLIDLATRGATVALSPVPQGPLLLSTQELASDSRSMASMGISAARRPSRQLGRVLTMAGVGLLALAAIAAGSLAVSRPLPVVTLVRDAVGGTRAVEVVALPPRTAPLISRTGPAATGAAAISPLEMPLPAQSTGTDVDKEIAAAKVAPGPAVSAGAAPAAARAGPAPIASARPVARPLKPAPIPKRKSPRQARAKSPIPSSGDGCSIRVGTRPWAEVWIDGRNTRRHTPYSEPIACGRHKLTFKRQDLGIARTFVITVSPADAQKQLFVLQAE